MAKHARLASKFSKVGYRLDLPGKCLGKRLAKCVEKCLALAVLGGCAASAYAVEAPLASLAPLESAASANCVPMQVAIDPCQILYIMQSGNTLQALDLYQQYYALRGQHNLDLIQQISFMILDQGSRSSDPEIQLLTILGAGISAQDMVLYILENGASSSIPEQQVASLGFLARLQSDSADVSINRAMSSNFLPVRLEALNYLALKKYPTATGQAEALMSKVPPVLMPLFPQIFAQIGDDGCIRIMRRMLHDQDVSVRIQTVLSAAKYGRDDLLPRIRCLASHHNAAQQEACAAALGALQDEASVSRLEALAASGTEAVRLSAAYALFQLGRDGAVGCIQKAAKESNPFAILLLGRIPGNEDLLAALMSTSQLSVRVNAALALLERQDSRCLSGLFDVLVRDVRDLAFVKAYSIGKALYAWRVVPSAKYNMDDEALVQELSMQLREETLQKALDLPENDFLAIADGLFKYNQNDLIPLLVQLLENRRSAKTIDLLKKYQQKAGAPLIRNYCNLALFRLKEPGPYGDLLRQWIFQQQHVSLIRLRPCMPLEMRRAVDAYQLNPEETSRILVDSLESLASDCDEQGLTALLHVIQHGNPKNKYALAGLLLRATE